MTTILCIASERVGTRSTAFNDGVPAVAPEGDLRQAMNRYLAPLAATV